jgi:hypothetical protein
MLAPLLLFIDPGFHHSRIHIREVQSGQILYTLVLSG